MAKFDNNTVNLLIDLFALGNKPTSQDYSLFTDAIEDGIESHEHHPKAGQESGTGNAEPIENLYTVFDYNLYNIHAWKRLLATRPQLASLVTVSSWQDI
jgi:hypothetical protein